VDASQTLTSPHRRRKHRFVEAYLGAKPAGVAGLARPRKILAEGVCKEDIVDDEVCTTHTHVARLRVMKTMSGRYRGIVYLHRIGEDPGSSEKHDTEKEFASDVEARDAARALARSLLEERES
jgi:hypothetical protein